MEKIEKYLAICICIAVCFQRLSMAAGSIFWGLSIAIFLYLLFRNYKANALSDIIQNYNGYYKAFAVFAICTLPSIFLSNDLSESAKKFLEMCIYRVIPFFMVTMFLKNTKWLRNIFLIFIVATSIDSLVAVGQVILNYGSRGWGFGGNTLNLASLLCVLMPMLLIVILDDSFSPKAKKICQIALICCFAGLLAGKSRGAWLTLLIMLPVVGYTYMLKNKKVLIGFLITLLAVGGFFATSESFKQRLVSTTNVTTDMSNVERLNMWQGAINMALDHPVLGVGLGGFEDNYNNIYKPEGAKDSIHCHNNILEIFAESGLVGLFGFLYLACYIFFKNFNEWRKTKNPYSLMIWGAWLGFMSFGMFDLTIDHSAITKAMWFLFGCILVFKNRKFYI